MRFVECVIRMGNSDFLCTTVSPFCFATMLGMEKNWIRRELQAKLESFFLHSSLTILNIEAKY